MALAQLVYVSRGGRELRGAVLTHLARQSATDNAKRDISGVLLACGPHLMQLLEGEVTEIVDLYEKIRRDPRHSEIELLICKNVNKRLCPDWGMELVDLDATAILNRDRLNGLIDDLRNRHNTSHYSAEARLLLHDFKSQLQRAA
jgi:hypothetical protein